MYRLDLLCFAAPFRFNLQTMRHFASQANSFSVVAECEGVICGFALVELNLDDPPTAAYLITLDVDPQRRRAGIASVIMADAEDQAVSAGAELLWLHVSQSNDAALRFYMGAGYERDVAVNNFYGKGLHAWVYAKRIGVHQSSDENSSGRSR